MSAAELILRILLALLLPPLGVIGIPGIGCGALLLLILLTMLFWLPGQITAIALIIAAYNRTAVR